jgi:hypothetical protein
MCRCQPLFFLSTGINTTKCQLFIIAFRIMSLTSPGSDFWKESGFSAYSKR